MAAVVTVKPIGSYIMTPQDEKRYQVLYDDLLVALKTQGMTKATIDAYTRAVRRVVQRTDKVPDTLTTKELKIYFADLLTSRAWSSVRSDRCGLMFFYRYVLEKEWNWVKIVKPPQIKRLPDILTVDEVYAVMAAVNKFRYRVCLFTIYSMGLRISEGVTLGTADIDSGRMLVHIRESKNHKDRYVPLPKAALYALRKHWATHRNPSLLFPSISGTTESPRFATTPMCKGAIQRAMRSAVDACRIKKKVSPHSLRHSYATHLVEAGINLRLIQEYLGHNSPVTTARYTHMTQVSQVSAEKAINRLMTRYVNKHGFMP